MVQRKGLSLSPRSSKQQFQGQLPGVSFVTSLNPWMLLHRMVVQKIGIDSPMRPRLLKLVCSRYLPESSFVNKALGNLH